MLKSLRFEFVALALLVVAVGLAALVVAWRIDAIHIPPACLYGSGPVVGPAGVPSELVCAAAQEAFYDLDGKAGLVFALTVFLPLLAGLALGVPLVARELETGTASLAWTLSRSRRRWFLGRAVPLVLIVGAILLVPVVATDILERTRLPGVDPWASFNDGSLRGPVILFRGLAALTLGIVVGAVLGRQLPALIVAGLLTLVVVGAVPLATQAYARTLAEWQPAEGTIGSVDMVFDFGYRDRATGEVLAYDEAYARAPVIPDVGPDEDWLATHYEPVSQVVAGRHYPQVAGLEWLLLGSVAVLSLGLCVVVVDRRRPS
jgi:hypothetical protein